VAERRFWAAHPNKTRNKRKTGQPCTRSANRC
jgi:hypothetical protein